MVHTLYISIFKAGSLIKKNHQYVYLETKHTYVSDTVNQQQVQLNNNYICGPQSCPSIYKTELVKISLNGLLTSNRL